MKLTQELIEINSKWVLELIRMNENTWIKFKELLGMGIDYVSEKDNLYSIGYRGCYYNAWILLNQNISDNIIIFGYEKNRKIEYRRTDDRIISEYHKILIDSGEDYIQHNILID